MLAKPASWTGTLEKSCGIEQESELAMDVTNREIHNDPTAEVIQAWLVSKLSERLGIESHEIDVREPFASYGLGSTEAVSLGW